MKILYTIIFFSLLLLDTSCSKETIATKRSIKYQKELNVVGAKLFDKYNKQTFLVPKQLDSLQLTTAEKKLLLKKIKCPYVHLIYDVKESRFFPADSVIIFTRIGFPIVGTQHNIVIDMRKTKRDSIEVDRNYIAYYKLAKGMYYIKDYMPEF